MLNLFAMFGTFGIFGISGIEIVTYSFRLEIFVICGMLAVVGPEPSQNATTCVNISVIHVFVYSLT